MRPRPPQLTTDDYRAGTPPAAGIPPPGAHRRRRRLTLGLCAHCHRPVEFGDDHVRLYRRAWHVDCALAAANRAPAE